MIHLINDIYAVEVPDPTNAIISGNVITWKNSVAQGRGFIALPAGNWQLICTTKECTEEQAKGLVKELPVGQRWQNYNGDYPIWWHTAKESLRSLLTSKGLDVNKNFVLIKKVS